MPWATGRHLRQRKLGIEVTAYCQQGKRRLVITITQDRQKVFKACNLVSESAIPLHSVSMRADIGAFFYVTVLCSDF